MAAQAKDGSGSGQGDNNGPMTGLGISAPAKSPSNPGQGDRQEPKAGMGIVAPSKAGSGSGQTDDQAPKTGMGIAVHHAHALLVGVGDCEYTKWSLPVTALDVDALEKALADPGLCGYQPANIRKLTHARATKDGILGALADLSVAAKDEADATFLIYYSGHGWHDETSGRYFLIPHDVLPHDIPGSAIPAEDFIAGLQQIRSARVLVIIDTCHASAMADAKDLAASKDLAKWVPKGFAVSPPSERALGEGKGRAVFLSCLDSQKSWILPGDRSLSIFTHHLLGGLRTAGKGIGEAQTRTVTVSDLMGYLSAQVPASAEELGLAQTPFFKFETSDFAVALNRGGKGKSAPEAEPLAEKPAAVHNHVEVDQIHANGDVVVAGHIGSYTKTETKR